MESDSYAARGWGLQTSSIRAALTSSLLPCVLDRDLKNRHRTRLRSLSTFSLRRPDEIFVSCCCLLRRRLASAARAEGAVGPSADNRQSRHAKPRRHADRAADHLPLPLFAGEH